MAIKVTALRRGFYGGKIREEGDTFSVEKETELGTWMQVDEGTAKRRGKKDKPENDEGGDADDV